MNLSFSYPSNVNTQLLSAAMNFSTDNGGPDTFKMVLMRDGFSFNASNHKNKINFTSAGTTGSINYTVTASTKTFTCVAPHSFVTDGFVIGNYITATGTNKGTYVVRSVSALAMRVDVVGAATIVDETAVSQTITTRDEMAAITTGVTPINFNVVASTGTITRTAYGTGSFITDGFAVGTTFTIDAGLNIGTYEVVSVLAASMVVTPVRGTAALEDETNTTGATFTNGYTAGGIAVTFKLTNDILTMDTFNWSSLGTALYDSQGVLVYDDTTTGDPVVCYGKLSPWTLSF